MDLNLFVARPGKLVETPSAPQSVIDSNSLREAALSASWRRDHRVAKRRQAWRWAIFWAWKYGPKAIATVLSIAAAFYVAVRFWPGMFEPSPPASSSPTASTAVFKAAEPTNEQTPEIKTGMRLVPTIALHPNPGTQAPTKLQTNESISSPSQPLRLTPEIQTSPKESSP